MHVGETVCNDLGLESDSILHINKNTFCIFLIYTEFFGNTSTEVYEVYLFAINSYKHLITSFTMSGE